MEWFSGSLLASLAPRVGRRHTPDLFQGSFVGSSKWFRRRVADGLSHGGGGFAIPSVAALLLPRFTALGRLSFNSAQVEFSAAKLSTPVPGRARSVVAVSQRTPALPEISRRAWGRPDLSK